MYKSKKYHRAFGVYGIYVEGNKLLVINKNGGPYKNRYDLPGGSLESGESLSVAIQREFKEETGKPLNGLNLKSLG
ncbi:NUDIX domain-containing protein [Salinibacillus kushneri]|uniref:NUDIX domain-containing protein n=1 Tax=Salinibacillus kushneri TaxID=237682 RepID=A0A1I0IHX7_9BACI|nr:NUDIX domain-containing protein [Salinibacillus kushneri]